MSALGELRAQGPAGAARPEVLEAAVQLVGPFMWRWFYAHSRDKILKTRVLGLISITLLVKDVKQVFVALFGRDPGPETIGR